MFFRDSGRPPIVRRSDTEGLGGVCWSVRRGGKLTWSHRTGSTRSTHSNTRLVIREQLESECRSLWRNGRGTQGRGLCHWHFYSYCGWFWDYPASQDGRTTMDALQRSIHTASLTHLTGSNGAPRHLTKMVESFVTVPPPRTPSDHQRRNLHHICISSCQGLLSVFPASQGRLTTLDALRRSTHATSLTNCLGSGGAPRPHTNLVESFALVPPPWMISWIAPCVYLGTCFSLVWRGWFLDLSESQGCLTTLDALWRFTRVAHLWHCRVSMWSARPHTNLVASLWQWLKQGHPMSVSPRPHTNLVGTLRWCR